MDRKRYACPSHCCIRHGCKYGYDDCPVATGAVKQEFPCEDCTDGIPGSDRDRAARRTAALELLDGEPESVRALVSRILSAPDPEQAVELITRTLQDEAAECDSVIRDSAPGTTMARDLIENVRRERDLLRALAGEKE